MQLIAQVFIEYARLPSLTTVKDASSHSIFQVRTFTLIDDCTLQLMSNTSGGANGALAAWGRALALNNPSLLATTSGAAQQQPVQSTGEVR